MSRMAAAALIAATAMPGTAQAAAPDVLMARFQEATRVEPRCNRNPGGNEIIVCGNRRADRWRVPFIGYDKGDPRGEGVSAERNRLASEPPIRCGEGAFLRNCGMVGVHVGAKFASGALKVRPLAP